MKALFDYIPLILFFVLYKTTEPTDSNHPILQLIGLWLFIYQPKISPRKAAMVRAIDDRGIWRHHFGAQ